MGDTRCAAKAERTRYAVRRLLVGPGRARRCRRKIGGKHPIHDHELRTQLDGFATACAASGGAVACTAASEYRRRVAKLVNGASDCGISQAIVARLLAAHACRETALVINRCRRPLSSASSCQATT